jgi:hypothetical protein
MAKAECDRTMTMNCLAKPTQRTGKPEAPARASVPERFRRLKWNEVVWSGDFVADERLGLQLWEEPGVFRPGSFARPFYRKEETERFRPTSTRKTKTMSNDPEVPARSAAIKPTQALWQNSSK